MKNNLEPVDSLLEFPKNFRPGKIDTVQEKFWKNISKKSKHPPVSMMTIEKMHYLRMKKVIDKLFYE
mgnify:CR=1 FL=1